MRATALYIPRRRPSFFDGQLCVDLCRLLTPLAFDVAGYLAIMHNSFDDDVVRDETCEEVPFYLYADCDTCECCKLCCAEDAPASDRTEAPCHFDVDFYTLSGLNCGGWWTACVDSY